MGKIHNTDLLVGVNEDGLRILARVIARSLLGSHPFNEDHLAESAENPNEAGYPVTNLPNDKHKSQIQARKGANENLP